MDINNVNEFVLHCRNIQPQRQENIKRFFEGVVGFPYDQELLLQGYLFLNVNTFFPTCTELLLFEKPLIGSYTNLGKCDFVFLTNQNSLFLIETKFIDTNAVGPTERKRRNKHRNKVFEQVIDLKNKLSEHWNIPIDRLECGVFTTDLGIIDRGSTRDVVTKSISINLLKQWREQYNTDV